MICLMKMSPAKIAQFIPVEASVTEFIIEHQIIDIY